MTECAYYSELMSQSLDGELTAEAQHSLMQHLETCPDCRNLYRQLCEIHSTFSSWEEQEVPEGFTRSVMEQIRQLDAPSGETDKIIPFRKTPRRKALGCIAACAALCLGLWGITHTHTPPALGQISIAAEPQIKSAHTTLPQPSDSENQNSDHADRFQPSDLAQQIRDLTGITPGTVLVLDSVPEELDGTWYTAKDGLTFLLVDTDQPSALLQQLAPHAHQTLTLDGDSLVLVLSK